MDTLAGRPATQGQILWTPSAALRERSALGRYLEWLRRERELEFADYDALWRWSVADLEGFWSSIWEHFEVRAHEPYERVLGSREMPGAEWFPGARLNYAEHMLGRDEDLDAVAIVGALAVARAARAHVRRAPRPGRPRPGRTAAARSRPRRPRRRIPPQHPGDARRLSRHREPRRDLGDVPAGVRRAQRAPPARPARAQAAARRRRVPLGRAARRPPRAGRRSPRRAAEPGGRRPRSLRGRRRRRAPRRAGVGRSPRPSRGRSSSSPCRSRTRSTSSSRPAPRGCRRRSCTGTAASCSST